MNWGKRPGQPVGEPVSVVSASDDNYAMPLAVTIRSAIDQLAPGRQLHVYILDGGLTDESKERLLRSWRAPQRDREVAVSRRLRANRRSEDRKPPEPGDLSAAVHADLLPPELDRVIFLDADLLIQKDLCELWETELGDAPIAAVNDYFTPYLNTREAIGRPSICDRHPGKLLPGAQLSRAGPEGHGGLFQRRRDAGQSGEVARDGRAAQGRWTWCGRHYEHVRYCDQYALNVLFSEKWKPLDPRWNQNSNLWAWNEQGPTGRSTRSCFAAAQRSVDRAFHLDSQAVALRLHASCHAEVL